MKDLIIGDVDLTACSAVTIGMNKICISENSADYWVSLKFLEINMKISKKHLIGKKLTEMIKNYAKWFEIEDFLLKVSTPMLGAELLKVLITNKTNNAYEQGKTDQQKTLRLALGLK